MSGKACYTFLIRRYLTISHLFIYPTVFTEHLLYVRHKAGSEDRVVNNKKDMIFVCKEFAA